MPALPLPRLFLFVLVRSHLMSKIWKRLQLSSKQNDLYNKANRDWHTLALHYPLLHKQTGTQIHIIGVHHNSPASLDRVQTVIRYLKPSAVLIELHKKTLDYVLAKSDLLETSRFQSRMVHVLQGSTKKPLILSSAEIKALELYGMSQRKSTKINFCMEWSLVSQYKRAKNLAHR